MILFDAARRMLGAEQDQVRPAHRGLRAEGRQGHRALRRSRRQDRRDGRGRHPDRRRRHPLRRARALLSRRRPAQVAGHPDVARRHRRQAVPRRRHHGAGGPSHPEVRLLSDQPRPCRARRGADQLDLRPAHGRRRHAAARGLEPAGQARGLPAALRGLELRLARRAGRDPQRPRHPRIPDGRPRSAAALEPWPHHAAGRRRASDVSDRLERRLAGDHRRRGDHPGAVWPAAIPRRPCSATSSAACRRWRASSRATGARASTSCSTSSSSARRRASPIWKACCRPTSWRRIVGDYKKLVGQDRETLLKLARAPIKNRPLSGPAVVAVYTGHHIAGRHRERIWHLMMTVLWRSNARHSSPPLGGEAQVRGNRRA